MVFDNLGIGAGVILVEGTRLIRVRVTPGARVDRCEEVDGVIRISTRAVAEQGRATEAARLALAEWLGVRPWQVELVSGGKSRQKVYRVLE